MPHRPLPFRVPTAGRCARRWRQRSNHPADLGHAVQHHQRRVRVPAAGRVVCSAGAIWSCKRGCIFAVAERCIQHQSVGEHAHRARHLPRPDAAESDRRALSTAGLGADDALQSPAMQRMLAKMGTSVRAWPLTRGIEEGMCRMHARMLMKLVRPPTAKAARLACEMHSGARRANEVSE